MKILVIGSGLIATSLVQRLESEGCELLVYSRNFNEKIKCRQVLGDIFDSNRFEGALKWRPQVIIHTAWITTPGIYGSDPLNFEYAQFTINLAKRVYQSDLEHLIVLGTCAEYGYQTEPSMAGVTKTSPMTLYAKQKVVAHNQVKLLLQESEVRLTWARIFHPYGPRQDQKRLIPMLANRLRNGEQVRLSDISSIYDWISTRDISSAISWIIHGQLPPEIDIGTSFGYTNLELLTILVELLNIRNRPPSPEVHDFGRQEMFVVNSESPLFRSGWAPGDSIHRGLEWVLGS